MNSQSDRNNQQTNPYAVNLEMAAKRTCGYRRRSREGDGPYSCFRLKDCCASSAGGRAQQRGPAIPGYLGSASGHAGSDGHSHKYLLSRGECRGCGHGPRMGGSIRKVGRYASVRAQDNTGCGTTTGTLPRSAAQLGGSLLHYCCHPLRPCCTAQVLEKYFSASKESGAHRTPSRPDVARGPRHLAVEATDHPSRPGRKSCGYAGGLR
jgi:hypothetical protein